MKDIVYHVKKGVAPVNFEDGLALLNQDTGEYYVINEVGKDIWEKLDGSKKLSEVIDLIVDEYDVDYKECESEVVTFISSLLLDGLVKE